MRPLGWQTGRMASTIWDHVLTNDLEVPTDRPLADLTAELTEMLGSTDPVERDQIAVEVLTTWIDRGVYDDLLVGLGDGMAAGLDVASVSPAPTRCSVGASRRVLAACLERGTAVGLPATKVFQWGDRVASWYVREQDHRGFVEGKGWAHAIAHGADAIGVLARSPHFGVNELTVLLDLIADRLLLPSDEPMVCGEPDRMADATAACLRRNLVPLTVLGPWVRRLVNAAAATSEGSPHLSSHNPQAFLRALYLKLAFAPDPPRCARTCCSC